MKKEYIKVRIGTVSIVSKTVHVATAITTKMVGGGIILGTNKTYPIHKSHAFATKCSRLLYDKETLDTLLAEAPKDLLVGKLYAYETDINEEVTCQLCRAALGLKV